MQGTAVESTVCSARLALLCFEIRQCMQLNLSHRRLRLSHNGRVPVISPTKYVSINASRQRPREAVQADGKR
jgi:hypothetical protein